MVQDKQNKIPKYDTKNEVLMWRNFGADRVLKVFKKSMLEVAKYNNWTLTNTENEQAMQESNKPVNVEPPLQVLIEKVLTNKTVSKKELLRVINEKSFEIDAKQTKPQLLQAVKIALDVSNNNKK